MRDLAKTPLACPGAHRVPAAVTVSVPSVSCFALVPSVTVRTGMAPAAPGTGVADTVGIKPGRGYVVTARAMYGEHPRPAPQGDWDSGRSILLDGCVMVGFSFVSVYAWARMHAS